MSERETSSRTTEYLIDEFNLSAQHSLRNVNPSQRAYSIGHHTVDKSGYAFGANSSDRIPQQLQGTRRYALVIEDNPTGLLRFPATLLPCPLDAKSFG